MKNRSITFTRAIFFIVAVLVYAMLIPHTARAEETKSGGFLISVIDGAQAFDSVLENLDGNIQLQYRVHADNPDEENEWQDYVLGSSLDAGNYEIQVIGGSKLSDEELATLFTLLSASYTEPKKTVQPAKQTTTIVNYPITSDVVEETNPIYDFMDQRGITPNQLIIYVAIATVLVFSLLYMIFDNLLKSYFIRGIVTKDYTVKIDVPLKKKQQKLSKNGTFTIKDLYKGQAYNITIKDKNSKEALSIIKVMLDKKKSTAEVLVNKGLNIETRAVHRGIEMRIRKEEAGQTAA